MASVVQPTVGAQSSPPSPGWDQPSPPPSAASVEPPAPRSASMQPHILIVDDSANRSRLLAPALVDAGFAVEILPEGTSALDAGPDASPSLILLTAIGDPQSAIAAGQSF